MKNLPNRPRQRALLEMRPQTQATDFFGEPTQTNFLIYARYFLSSICYTGVVGAGF